MNKPGPTGEFPRGPLNKHDEGSLTIAVGIEKDCVRIDFGSPTAWIALPKEQAVAFAKVILAKAERIEKGEPREQA